MKTYLPYAIAIIFAILFLHQCNRTEAARNETQSVADFLNDSIRTHINREGKLVSEKTALKGDRDVLSVLLSKQVDSTGQLKNLVKRYSKTLAAGNITTIVEIDSIPIPFEVPVPFEFERVFKKIDPFYSLSGTSTHTGITISDLKIPNVQSFVIDQSRGKAMVRVVNSNPYISVTGLDTYVLDRPVKRFGLSLYAGYGYSKEGLSPSVGVGLTYLVWVF